MATAAAAGAQPAQPDLAEAARLYHSAEQAMTERRYDEAARDYGAAYEISKDGVLFFKIASALDKAGKCPVAVNYYRRYLREGKPSAEHQKLTSERIAACEAQGKQGDAPKGDAPKADAPKADGPKADGKAPTPPKTDGKAPTPPKTDGKADAPKADAPKADGKTDAPKADGPKADGKTDAPKTDGKAKPASADPAGSIAATGEPTPSTPAAPAAPASDAIAEPQPDAASPLTATPPAPTPPTSTTPTMPADDGSAEPAADAAAESPDAAPAAEGAEGAESFPPPSPRRTAAWLSVGTGIAFVTIGAVLALSAESTEDDIADLYITRPGGEPLEYGGGTKQRYDELVERGDRYETLAWASFGIAAAAAGAATYFFLTSKPTSEAEPSAPVAPATALRPMVHRHGGGVAAAWQF